MRADIRIRVVRAIVPQHANHGVVYIQNTHPEGKEQAFLNTIEQPR
jgi:hypothetical protein